MEHPVCSIYAKCWFIVADDCLCYENDHLNNLLGHNNSKNEHVPGWMVDVAHGLHDHHAWSKKYDPNGHAFQRCGNGTKWFGFAIGNDEGMINTNLSGCGNATLDFGNCNGYGRVVAFKNGKELCVADGLKNKTITFEFFDGDSIEIRENGGIILLNNFVQYPCPGESKNFIHIR